MGNTVCITNKEICNLHGCDWLKTQTCVTNTLATVLEGGRSGCLDSEDFWFIEDFQFFTDEDWGTLDCTDFGFSDTGIEEGGVWEIYPAYRNKCTSHPASSQN